MTFHAKCISPAPPQHAPGGRRAEAVLVHARSSGIAKQRAGAQGVGPLGPHLELRQLRRSAAAAVGRLLGRIHRLGCLDEVQSNLLRRSGGLSGCEGATSSGQRPGLASKLPVHTQVAAHDAGKTLPPVAVQPRKSSAHLPCHTARAFCWRLGC